MPPLPSIQTQSHDRYSMIINGERVVIRSGAMHYFRLPSQDLWRDRLLKLKAAGYNTVDLYFNWGFHSPEPGVYDFSGIRDVKHLLQLTQDIGLYVIARPGPYINAEVSGGGFPYWLLSKKEIPLRHRRHGEFVWSDEYMAYLREWWGQILPIVNQFDNVLMMQIENEYSTLEMEAEPMQSLYELAREFGVKVPLSHNDLFIAGLYEDIVDLYAFDNYSVTQFDTDWRTMTTTVFSVLDNVEASLRPFCQDRPLIAAELQAGWFGTWQGLRYEKIWESLGREHIALTTKSLIGQGLTVFNHYKAIGGTNWAHLGSTETYTSYDFGAPIAESGLNTPRLYEAKALNYFLKSFEIAATDRVENSVQSELVYVTRKSIDSNAHWLFLRNLSEQFQEEVLTLANEKLSVEVRGLECLILPLDVPLKSGVTVVAANTEFLYQDEKRLVIKGNRSVQAIFKTESPLSELSHEWVELGPNTYCLALPQLSPREIKRVSLGELIIIVLGQEAIDHLWLINEDLIIGPDAIVGDEALLSKTLSFRIDANGHLDENPLVAAHPAFEVPTLSEWQIQNAAPELLAPQAFRPIADEGPDFDANGEYDGCGWYRVQLNKLDPKKNALLELEARHIWCVFWNGEVITHSHYLTYVNDANTNQLIKIDIPAAKIKPDVNELILFVDGLGHPKGFHDDQQMSPGLIQLNLNGKSLNSTLTFSGGLFFEKGLASEPAPRTPIIKLDTTFTWPSLKDKLDVPLGLVLSDLPYERVNIYLNDILVGREWRQCRCQDMFYLPPGILNEEPGAENRLSLVCMNFEPLIGLSSCRPGFAQVMLKPYGVYARVSL